MIVSHKHRFIFIAIPKTGTHAIRFALRKHMGEEDVEQVKLFVDKKSPYPHISTIPHGHIKAKAIRTAVGEEVWNSYFKFACVRNPWDKFISYAFFMQRKSGLLSEEPLAMLKKIAKDPRQKKKILFSAQHDFVTDNSGKLIIDELCRYEDLQGSYDKICQRIGIPTETLEVINKSEHLPYRDYYDEELRDLVRTLYAKDVELFNYQF